MRPLIGPHLGGQWFGKLDLLRQWQPPLFLVLQPDADKVRQLREACPHAILVGRFYHDDSHYAHHIRTRPVEFAREIHQEIANHPATPLLDYVQSNNEVCQDWDNIPRLNQFTLEWMALADQSQAYKCAILAFSVGSPDLPNKPGDPAGFDGRMLYWQQVLPSLNYAQQHGHILALHAYGWPDLFHPDADWYIYRYERQVQPRLKQLGITQLRYAYTELGIDKLITGEKGGYQVATNDQDYVNQLLQWERDLQDQPLLLGGAIFTFGDSGGWGAYDIASTNVASMLAAHYANRSKATVPAAPKTETVFMPKVSTGGDSAPTLPPRKIAADFTRRVPQFVAHQETPGSVVYRLVRAAYVPDGAKRFGPDHHILVDVIDTDGKRMMGAPVNFYWAGGIEIATVNKAAEPYGVDFGMRAHGHSYGVWVGSFRQSSDDVFGMGLGTIEWPDWNHHVTYYLVFQRVTVPRPPVIAPGPTDPVQETIMTTGIIEPRVAQAILRVESGGRTHGPDGTPLIRFEAHIFKQYVSDAGQWATYFRTDPQRGWVNQEWRRSPGDPWRAIHTGSQADEYAAFEFARSTAREGAYKSISVGAPQIMGFNHARVGFPSAEAMYHAFKDAQVQTIAFINYFLSDPALMEAARRKDFREVARRYNGTGQIDHYAALLQQAYDELGTN